MILFKKSTPTSTLLKQIKTKPSVPEVKQNITKSEEGIVKTSQKTNVPKSNNTTQVTTAEAVVLEKTSELKPPSMNRKPDGHYELSPLMKRMVEVELQNLMVKVWQDLPDEPSGDAEKFVVNKLRKGAGHDLKNTLGLNVTKRLLNIFNPLYVKINFTTKPEGSQLSDFIRQYNITAFKRIETDTNTFAAQIKTIEGFDAICSAKDLCCGSAEVTVTPCYRFMKCPPKVRTTFAGIEVFETKETEPKPIAGKTLKTQDIEKVRASTAKSKKNTNLAEAKPKAENKINEKKDDTAKETDKPNENTSSANKCQPIREALTKCDVSNKAIDNKIDSTKKTENIFTDKKAISIVKLDKEATKLKAEDKGNESKETNKTIVKKMVEFKLEKIVKQMKPDKEISKVDNNSPKSKETKGNTVSKDAKVFNRKIEKTSGHKSDFDELDDHDILALISEGIVLDECSGSDDE